MNNAKEIADILFPDVTGSIDDYIKKYPVRNLPEGALVTRFAPSPTGFLHIGGLFTSLIAERLAHQSGGLFLLRIEDTDKKREIEDGVSGIISALREFQVKIDEGVVGHGEQRGDYGPYIQSERKEIYHVFIKALIAKGYAYPCFCTTEALEASRKEQEAQKVRPGYYGTWAVHRNDDLEDIKKNLEVGKGFVVRLRSEGKENSSFEYHDLVKGKISVTENDQDHILMKSDGLPTYHFAHVVDDYLMRTNPVIRADEWLSSLPIHLELFKAFDWSAPQYGHVSPIMKSDNGTRRKLSKRKDPEAAVSYYNEKGYPIHAVIEYLLNIANSAFEDWRKANPALPNTEFHIALEKMSKSGALFDIAKLNDISKDVVSRMSAEDVYAQTLAWAAQYDPSFAELLTKHKQYVIDVLSIERTGDKPRKDIAVWSEVKDQIGYFFDDIYAAIPKNILPLPETVSSALAAEILTAYAKVVDINMARDEWFEAFRVFAEGQGFARDAKSFKANPAHFKGQVGDVAMVIRVALTGKSRTPDLYEIMKVLSLEKAKGRMLAVAKELV